MNNLDKNDLAENGAIVILLVFMSFLFAVVAIGAAVWGLLS